MNDDTKIFAKILFCSYFFLTGPVGIVFFIYIFLRDMSFAEALYDKDFVMVESLLLGGWIYSFWMIKRNSWDFWSKRNK
jgi:hypothetical protein